MIILHLLAAAIISPNSKQHPALCHGPQKSIVLHEATSEEVKIIIDNLLLSESVRMMVSPYTFSKYVSKADFISIFSTAL